MKEFITSHLVDLVDDQETTLKHEDIPDAAEFIWQAYDCTEMYEQVETLLNHYLAIK